MLKISRLRIAEEIALARWIGEFNVIRIQNWVQYLYRNSFHENEKRLDASQKNKTDKKVNLKIIFDDFIFWERRQQHVLSWGAHEVAKQIESAHLPQ